MAPLSKYREASLLRASPAMDIVRDDGGRPIRRRRELAGIPGVLGGPRRSTLAPEELRNRNSPVSASWETRPYLIACGAGARRARKGEKR